MLVFFCILALFLGTSPINAVILRSVPTELRASAMASAIFAIHVLGDLWSPPFVGVLADHLPDRDRDDDAPRRDRRERAPLVAAQAEGRRRHGAGSASRLG